MVTELHGVAVDLSYWLSGMHVLAAVCHRLRCDGVWSAMTSVWKETPNSFRDKDARWDFVYPPAPFVWGIMCLHIDL